MIVGSLDKVQVTTAFRLTCRRIGHCEDTQAGLYRQVKVSLDPWSIARLGLVPLDNVPNSVES